MTEASVPTPGNPRDLLAGLGDLTRKVRTAQRGTWFPLLLLGLLLLGGIVVDRLTFSRHGIACPAAVAGAGVACSRVKQGSPLYWSLGLVLVYVATAVFYFRRARSRGVGSVVSPYVIAGIALLLLVAPTRFWNGGVVAPGAAVDFFGMHFHASTGTEDVLTRLTGRAVSIGAPLLVLAWLERNRALAVFAVGYLVIELVPITLAGGRVAPSPWSALSQLAVPAAYLLIGALGFAIAQRPEMPLGGAEPVESIAP